MLLAILCFVISAFVALRELYAVGKAPRLDWAPLRPVLLSVPKAEALLGLMKSDPQLAQSWEVRLLEAVYEAPTEQSARAEVNCVLGELDLTFPLSPAFADTCVRISVLGTLFAIALVVAGGRWNEWTRLFDIISFGGAGVVIALACRNEVRRLVSVQRSLIDALVDRLLSTRWAS